MRSKSIILKADATVIIFKAITENDNSKIHEAKDLLSEIAKMYKVSINKKRTSKRILSDVFCDFIRNKGGYSKCIEPLYHVLNNLK